MSMQPSDSAARHAAIDPTASFLVQAPAGSGKTELLTDRILALLGTVSRPEEIVAITFTRKAAAEMHARVLSKLALADGPPPTQPYQLASWELAKRALHRNNELGWDLLSHPARLSIRTIDAFCSYLVKAMPWLSALGGMPGIAENADSHYQAAAQATLSMIEESSAVADLLEHLDLDLAGATDTLATMLGQRDQWLPLLAEGSDPEQLVANLDQAISHDLQAVAEAMPVGWSVTLVDALKQAAAELAERGTLFVHDALHDWDGRSLGTTTSDVVQWQAIAFMLLKADGKLRQTVDVRQGCPPKSPQKTSLLAWLKSADPDEAWVEALENVRSLPLDGYTPQQRRTLATFIQVLWLAAAQLQLEFSDTGEVDFIEIAQRALQALGDPDDPTDLLLILDNQISHILVDEFQDTSQSQIDLLVRLTAGWQPGDGRTLFLVGDPMQSIYRFRKAEVGWFLRVKEHGLGSVSLQSLELTNNFRSQAALVHAVNRLCGPVFPPVDHTTLGAIRYTSSIPFNDPIPDSDVEFHPVWLPKVPRGEAAPDGADVMDAVVVELARQALDRYPDSSHPVAILVRARSHLNDVVLRLAQAGLPCRAVDLVTLQQRQVVVDLVQLARALSHEGDRLAWLAVLRSPLCGLTLASLHDLFGTDRDSSVPVLLRRWLHAPQSGPLLLEKLEAQRLRHAANVLLDSGNASGAMPFAAWLEHCWKRLGGHAVYHSDSDRADAESLVRLVEELAPYGSLNPADLEARLAKLYAAPNSSGRAIEVMTIHKAKGLEFETVIIPGLCKQGRAGRAPLIRVEQSEGRVLLGPIKRSADDQADPVSDYLNIRERKRSAFELDRLLYVALTRARSELHLVASVSVDESGNVAPPASTSLLARLWGHLDIPDPPPFDELVAMPNQSKGAAEQRFLVRPAASVMAMVADTKGSVPPPQWAGMWPPENEAMNAPIVHDSGRQRRQLLAGKVWDDKGQTNDERILGTVAHAWLERIGRDGADAWPVQRLDSCQPVFMKQLARAGIVPERTVQAAGVLHETLVATLSSKKGCWLLQAARAYREWALLDLSGRVSVIDLAISQEENWLVVDYKTGVPGPDESTEQFAQRMRTTYHEQLTRYCSHVSALDGRPARGALFFPRADLWIDC